MTVYANMFSSGSTIKIEIEGDSVDTSKAFAPDLVSAVENMAEIVAEGINRLSDEKRPSDVEISYALKAMSAGGYAVTSDQEHANFKITLRWGGGVGLPGEISPSNLAVPQA